MTSSSRFNIRSETHQYEAHVSPTSGKPTIPADFIALASNPPEGGFDAPEEALLYVSALGVNVVRTLSSDECRTFGENMIELANKIDECAAAAAIAALDRAAKGPPS